MPFPSLSFFYAMTKLCVFFFKFKRPMSILRCLLEYHRCSLSLYTLSLSTLSKTIHFPISIQLVFRAQCISFSLYSATLPFAKTTAVIFLLCLSSPIPLSIHLFQQASNGICCRSFVSFYFISLFNVSLRFFLYNTCVQHANGILSLLRTKHNTVLPTIFRIIYFLVYGVPMPIQQICMPICFCFLCAFYLFHSRETSLCVFLCLCFLCMAFAYIFQKHQQQHHTHSVCTQIEHPKQFNILLLLLWLWCTLIPIVYTNNGENIVLITTTNAQSNDWMIQTVEHVYKTVNISYVYDCLLDSVVYMNIIIISL